MKPYMRVLTSVTVITYTLSRSNSSSNDLGSNTYVDSENSLKSIEAAEDSRYTNQQLLPQKPPDFRRPRTVF